MANMGAVFITSTQTGSFAFERILEGPAYLYVGMTVVGIRIKPWVNPERLTVLRCPVKEGKPVLAWVVGPYVWTLVQKINRFTVNDLWAPANLHKCNHKALFTRPTSFGCLTLILSRFSWMLLLLFPSSILECKNVVNKLAIISLIKFSKKILVIMSFEPNISSAQDNP